MRGGRAISLIGVSKISRFEEEVIVKLKQRWARLALRFIDWLESIALPEDDSTESNVEMAKMRQEAKRVREEISKDL